jgi:hypothetical protein
MPVARDCAAFRGLSGVMAFAILKLSYHAPGDACVVGGICGTGFFLASRTAVTAYHSVNDQTFKPNDGFQHASIWLISRIGSILTLNRDYSSFHPKFDTTIISLPNDTSNIHIYEPSRTDVGSGTRVCGIGHRGGLMPAVKAYWRDSELFIESATLADVTTDSEGSIVQSMIFDVNAADIKMHNVRGFELSFGSHVGMSGGPVLEVGTDRVLAMMSVGLPPDSRVKKRTFAVSIAEITTCLTAKST